MRKIFLLLAFTGIVGAASANTLMSLTKSTLIVVGDDKKGDDKKKDEKSCSHDGKSCCKKGEAKSCSHDGKSGAKADSKTADSKATSAAPAKK